MIQVHNLISGIWVLGFGIIPILLKKTDIVVGLKKGGA
jgi:hypothetical protein